MSLYYWLHALSPVVCIVSMALGAMATHSRRWLVVTVLFLTVWVILSSVVMATK